MPSPGPPLGAGSRRDIAVTFLVLALCNGCAGGTRTIQPSRAGAPGDPLSAPGGVRVTAYTTSDGVRHPFIGRVQFREDGLFHFDPAGSPRPTEAPIEPSGPFVLPRLEVAALDLGPDGHIMTAVGVAAVIFGVGMFVYWAVMSIALRGLD